MRCASDVVSVNGLGIKPPRSNLGQTLICQVAYSPVLLPTDALPASSMTIRATSRPMRTE